MKDMLQDTETHKITAIEIGKLLKDHRAADIAVIDMRQLNFWTDFFIIATVTSSTHVSGLDRHIKEFAAENELQILRRSRHDSEDEWRIIDFGDIVIHLMTEKSRSFFELERLWSSAVKIDFDRAV